MRQWLGKEAVKLGPGGQEESKAKTPPSPAAWGWCRDEEPRTVPAKAPHRGLCALDGHRQARTWPPPNGAIVAHSHHRRRTPTAAGRRTSRPFATRRPAARQPVDVPIRQIRICKAPLARPPSTHGRPPDARPLPHHKKPRVVLGLCPVAARLETMEW